MIIPAATTSTVNAIAPGTAGSGGAVTLPTLTGDGTLNVTTTLADKWYALNGLAGFTGTLNLTGVDAGTPMHVRLTTAGGGADLSDVVLNMNDARISNRQGGAAGGIATFEIGEVHSDTNSQMRAYEGGGTAQNANWQIGALNTNSDFAGLIVDNPPTGAPATISHVTKVGDGILTLTGVNTYTGMTRVWDGTLSISNAYLANAADVALSPAYGAIFNLDFVGADTIDSLFFDGVSQATGTWGAVGSGADHEHASFTGTGMLLVSTQPTPILVGDYNGDGSVDAADYVVWRKAVGAAAILNRNPTNFGAIGQREFIDWRIHFGKTSPGSGSGVNEAVPEPTAWLLSGIALGAACWLRRKRA
jgi:autotransporter-associated beta strand protein